MILKKNQSLLLILMQIIFMVGQCARNFQHSFKWMIEEQLTNEEVIKLLKKKITNHGYVFEVHLEYPKKLWKYHNDYPLVPEKKKLIMLKDLLELFIQNINMYYIIKIGLDNVLSLE